MKHDYTWNHILLLAKICEKIEDSDSITASWVEIVENHHKKTFPFTLWPLSYRTSDITTSPAISSPIRLSGDDLGCNYSVKMYRCNEVIIVCIQEDCIKRISELECCQNCNVEEEFNSFDGNSKFHSLHHSKSNSKPLMTCKVAHNYFNLRQKSMDSLYGIQHETAENIDSIIITGFGESSLLASCLAVDISRGFEREREFLGMESKRVCVDFIGFSTSLKASPLYWASPTISIDMYLTITLNGLVKSKNNKDLEENPRNTIINLTHKKSPSMCSKMSKFFKFNTVSQIEDEKISDYVDAINTKIIISNSK